MKILITTDVFTVKTNGVVTSITNLTDELQLKGHDVRILTLSDSSLSYVNENVYYIGSFSMNKIYPGIRGTLLRKNHILNELIQWHPDIIHSQCEFFSFRFAKILSRHCSAPIVHTYHTLYEDYVGYLRVPAANKKIVKHLTRHRLNGIRTIIAPSHKVLSILEGYGMGQDIRVIPSGISIDKHLETYSAEKKKALRSTMGIREDAFVLISLGRLGKEKNIDELLIGMSWVIDENPNTILLIVGDGPERAELENWVRHLELEKNVIFTGAVPPEDVHTYYQIADVFVSASTSETQGLVYIEAAANGLPLICHRDSCLQGIIDEHENGFCYETLEEFEKAFMHCLRENEFRKTASMISRKNALLFGAVIFNFIIYNGARMLASGFKHHTLSTTIDTQIPLISWTVWIYWGCYLFWIINYYIGTRYDKGNGCSFIGAHYIGEATLPPEYRFTDPDPYFKLQPVSPDRQHRNVWFDEDGHLHAKNLSAWWIPDLSIEREIGGTVYTVTGSFDGEECMLRKLERISAKKFTNTEEDANDTDE